MGRGRRKRLMAGVPNRRCCCSVSKIKHSLCMCVPERQYWLTLFHCADATQIVKRTFSLQRHGLSSLLTASGFLENVCVRLWPSTARWAGVLTMRFIHLPFFSAISCCVQRFKTSFGGGAFLLLVKVTSIVLLRVCFEVN